MTYIKPEDVVGTATNVRVLFDGGDESYAVALVNWKGKEMYAIRWNGDDRKPGGFPLFGKTPLWMVLPEEIAVDGIAGIIGKAYQ
ncbi:hypothetical protein G7062_01520 [Erysipelothrix sp. HDW6C]|uniref:hypothetical protein n=1 Tax=Erysipelothrix sp. HDW6C TaxID=2714930 RepID=UPI00140DD33B|nr:hypothetical protein [Erysipelothrix sp. HDW6C]QIK69040.1 hypothetical protein G7062_01520 [Erysipelothrix sp. HDW6C]